MSACAVRNVTGADVAAITAIYTDAVLQGTASFEIEPPDAAEMDLRMRRLIEAGYPYLVAEENGAVLGYAYGGPYRPRAAYRSTIEDSVYMAAAARGRGIRRRLLGRLIAESETPSFRQMVAAIGDSAQVASIALHASCGFAVAGTLTAVGYKAGLWLDTVLMQRPLGAAATSPPVR